MGNDQLTEALRALLQPGETVQVSRPVVGSGKVEAGAYSTSLALLGPAAYRAAAAGAVTGGGSVPEGTNLVVVTDRRVLWCSRSRLGSDVTLLGADHLDSVQAITVVPARIALAKLRVQFHDGATVQFDLPSDRKAEAFVAAARDRLVERPLAA